MEYIQIQKDNILKIGIKTSDGKDTGEHLEFDLEDLELLLKLSNIKDLHNQNLKDLRAQLMFIEKREDKKGKKLLSLNQESKIKALNEFYKKEMNVIDLFLGEGGTKKMLNGRNPYYSMYDDIIKSLEPILPLIEKNAQNIEEKIKNKYSKKDDDILE